LPRQATCEAGHRACYSDRKLRCADVRVGQCALLFFRQSCPEFRTALRSSHPSRACGKGHLLPSEFPQALKSFFNGKDDEVCVFGNPRRYYLLRSEEELVLATSLPDAASLLEFLQHAAILRDGDHRVGWREAFKMVRRERYLDPGSCDWTGRNDASRASEYDRQKQCIWGTPRVERPLLCAGRVVRPSLHVTVT
jgi:hypothetical protein